jgi:hypothetical protein
MFVFLLIQRFGCLIFVLVDDHTAQTSPKLALAKAHVEHHEDCLFP